MSEGYADMTQQLSDGNSKDYRETFKNINCLTKGFVDLYQPNLKKTKDQLQELEDKQKQLTQYVHEQNLKLAKTHDLELQMEMFDMMKDYEKRLSSLKKDMRYLHEWGIKLRTRAEKIEEAARKAQRTSD